MFGTIRITPSPLNDCTMRLLPSVEASSRGLPSRVLLSVVTPRTPPVSPIPLSAILRISRWIITILISTVFSVGSRARESISFWADTFPAICILSNMVVAMNDPTSCSPINVPSVSCTGSIVSSGSFTPAITDAKMLTGS